MLYQLDQQIQERRKLYPETHHLSKIRFTEEELNAYFNESCQIVSQVINTQDQKEITETTQNIWVRIFQKKDILEPIKQQEWRFCLDKDITSNDIYHLVTTSHNDPLSDLSGVKGSAPQKREYHIVKLQQNQDQPKDQPEAKLTEDEKFLHNFIELHQQYQYFASQTLYQEDNLFKSQIIKKEALKQPL